MCKISQYKVYQDGKETLDQGKFDAFLSLKGLPKYSNYTVKFFDNGKEIEDVKFHFKIPREKKMS